MYRFFLTINYTRHYPQILQTLSSLIGRETSAQARDNIIGAIARLIITNHTIIPMDQVFPVFISHLPLKEDLEENKTVYKCLQVLYRNGHAVLTTHIPTLLKVGLDILENKASDDGKFHLLLSKVTRAHMGFIDMENFLFSFYFLQRWGVLWLSLWDLYRKILQNYGLRSAVNCLKIQRFWSNRYFCKVYGLWDSFYTRILIIYIRLYRTTRV